MKRREGKGLRLDLELELELDESEGERESGGRYRQKDRDRWTDNTERQKKMIRKRQDTARASVTLAQLKRQPATYFVDCQSKQPLPVGDPMLRIFVVHNHTLYVEREVEVNRSQLEPTRSHSFI